MTWFALYATNMDSGSDRYKRVVLSDVYDDIEKLTYIINMYHRREGNETESHLIVPAEDISEFPRLASKDKLDALIQRNNDLYPE